LEKTKNEHNMQTENSMNKIRQLVKFGKGVGVLIAFLFVHFGANAQCSITVSGAPCVGEPVVFNCNSVGASNYNWNFNGEGTNTTLCNPSFTFNSPGQKTITLSLRLANGSTCTATYTLDVKPKPIINVKRIVNQTQCFANNSFCFTDSSKSGEVGGQICRTVIVFDDGTRYSFSGNGPRQFCHSFGDPAGGTYGMTIEVEDCNGCLTKTRLNAVAIVQASLGLTFTSPRPQRCDSVQLCVTNNSTVPLSQITSFRWDWGDGQVTNGTSSTPQFWGNPGNNPNPPICHWFYAQGPNGGNFNTKLTVTSTFGCTESFTFTASATNLIVKPVIIADRDSVCFNDKTIQFRLKNGAVPLATNPVWNFGNPPSGPLNIVRQWTGTHAAWGLGPYKINFSFQHPIPGCGKTVYDTILVIGPQSTIEGAPPAGMKWLIDSLRYQCVIKDTVKFWNFSKFYHNDKDMTDDDSVIILAKDSIMINKTTGAILDPTTTVFNPSSHEWVKPGFNAPLIHGFNNRPNGQTSLRHHNQQRGNDCTIRLWDFDDDYCEKCTTDTKNGINIGKNCKFSKDSLPQHWYTPWDSLYQTTFGLRSESVFRYDRDSGLCFQRRMWSNDSVAIIRDTFLFYGDNPIGNKTKDSTVFANIDNKIKVPSGVQGKARIDITIATRVYVPTGDTLFVDPNNGFPPNRWIGQRYVTLQPGTTLILNSKTDKILYHYWIQTIQDTIPLHLVQPWHKVWKKDVMRGYQKGDSINADAHRQKFYSGDVVRCFNVRLKHVDVCHPLKCEHEATASLALQPPSAKKLRKEGVLCLGGAQQTYGITFILEDTKPGCSRTWAEINYDTALNKNGWLPLIGPNLGAGQVATGALPPVNPPYLGYNLGGPAPGRFSKQFTVDDIKDTITGYINVGLIVGNGMWTNNLNNGINPNTWGYPTGCSDTVYYNKFARFPILDNNFRIIKPKEGEAFTKICRKDTICLTTNVWNRSYVPDVAEALWTLTGANVGKFYNQYYILSASERYQRFKTIHPDTPYLEDRLQVVKQSFFDGRTVTLDSQNFRVAKVTKWHTEADITPVFDIIKAILEFNNIDIYELTPAQLNDIIWNGQGQFGKPYTGSRGCLDTTGFGRFIRFYKVADEKQSLHYRDTSLIPIERVKGWDGKNYNAYCFKPQFSGYYIANFGLRSTAPENCNKSTGTAKKVIVGFYGVMNYTDTIICHGSEIVAEPQFRYFEVFPEITFRLLDPTDYWRTRISEAGNPNRETPTRWDLNKDDDGTHPQSIYGGFPYGASGLGNPQISLGGVQRPGSLYYNQDTGRVYTIRTAAGDSATCRDTFTQDIYVTAVRAKFDIDQKRPQCNTIIELFDSSYVQDPCMDKLKTPCDRIIRWTINWGDKASNSINNFFNTLPTSIGHDYTRNGRFNIILEVETALGCIDRDTMEIYIPGPIPLFDTLINRKYCVGERVDFSNLSTYLRADSSIWLWSFGDGVFGNQTDTITSTNDTMSHRYTKAGTYSIFLYQYFKLKVGNTTKTCAVVYPDTTNGQEAHFTIEITAYDSSKVNATPVDVCIGDTVFINGEVHPYGRYTNYKWNFGVNSTDTLISPDTAQKRTYNAPGRYVIRFSGDVNSASSLIKICPGEDSVVVNVGNVVADFQIDSTNKPVFCFNNTSTNNVKNFWSFYNDGSNINNPTGNKPTPKIYNRTTDGQELNDPQVCEDYRDSLGEYWVCLEVESAIGCTDTICKKVYNDFKASIRPPNVFTPNTDNFTGVDKEGLVGNNVFNIEINGQVKYDLVIYDRWGVRVFESTDANKDWNGKVNNTGAICPDGTYYYILKYRYKGIDKDEEVLNGVVRIIR
jgi:gliding motility-associated-like protein